MQKIDYFATVKDGTAHSASILMHVSVICHILYGKTNSVGVLKM